MPKQWAAMLSMLGLMGPVAKLQAQAVNGSNPAVANENTNVKTGTTAQKTTGKLSVNQQTLRQQNQGGQNGKYPPQSTTCQTGKQGSANNQLTPPPPGSTALKGKNSALTKTKGSSNNLNVNQQTLRNQNTSAANGGKQTQNPSGGRQLNPSGGKPGQSPVIQPQQTAAVPK